MEWQAVNDEFLVDFAIESNKIEGIFETSVNEVEALRLIVNLQTLTIGDINEYVYAVSGASLRRNAGMDVRVGNHIPPAGGSHVVEELDRLVMAAETGSISAYDFHLVYENLHPYMDGNGRSGRALWLRYAKRERHPYVSLGFLHAFYYDTLKSQDFRIDR